MKITAIAPNNNYNKTVFKGESRTYYKQRCSSYTTEERFYLPDRLITLHQPDSNAREVTAYIASPFEIVSEDNLNKNNFLQRNDLFLSQIKKDYRNGYFSFAENAREEIKFLTGLRDDLKTRYERNKELISRYNDRNGTEIFSDNEAQEKYQNRKKEKELIANEEKKQLDKLNSQIETAKERYNMLVPLDNIGGKKNDLMRQESYVKYSISTVENHIKSRQETIEHIKNEIKETKLFYDKKIERINKTANHEQLPDTKELHKQIKIRQAERIKLLKEDYKNKKEELKQQIVNEELAIHKCKQKKANLDARLQDMYKEFAELDKQLDAAYAKVAEFYQKNYPDWL